MLSRRKCTRAGIFTALPGAAVAALSRYRNRRSKAKRGATVFPHRFRSKLPSFPRRPRRHLTDLILKNRSSSSSPFLAALREEEEEEEKRDKLAASPLRRARWRALARVNSSGRTRTRPSPPLSTPTHYVRINQVRINNVYQVLAFQ